MAMNSFSWKLDLVAARRKRSSEATDGLELTRTLTQLEGLSGPELRDLRGRPLKPIDLNQLKRTYAHDRNLGRRVAPRFALRLKVIVFNAGSSFRTESLNVSASGALLKDSLPAKFMGVPFEILLIHENPRTGAKSHLLFTAKCVAGPRGAFQSVAGQAMRSLQDLFDGREPLV